MSFPWLVRIASEQDRSLLAEFVCARPEVRYEEEVQHFIQTSALAWAMEPGAQQGDPRILLTLQAASGELVGVATHERVTLRNTDTGGTVAATRLDVVALSGSWQGRRFALPDGGAVRASDVVMSAVLADISQRVPPRDARVMALVHRENFRSLSLCKRYGLTLDLPCERAGYRRLITPAKRDDE